MEESREQHIKQHSVVTRLCVYGKLTPAWVGCPTISIICTPNCIMIEFENEPIKTLRMYKSKQQTFLAVVDGERSIQNTQKNRFTKCNCTVYTISPHSSICQPSNVPNRLPHTASSTVPLKFSLLPLIPPSLPSQHIPGSEILPCFSVGSSSYLCLQVEQTILTHSILNITQNQHTHRDTVITWNADM